jgi:hypothetical protein
MRAGTNGKTMGWQRRNDAKGKKQPEFPNSASRAKRKPCHLADPNARRWGTVPTKIYKSPVIS